jgi:hypothetical protein
MKALKERLQELQDKQAEREKDLRTGNIRIERQDDRSASQRAAEKPAKK